MNCEYKSKLRSMTLFADFTEPELEAFLELVDPVDVKMGTCIVRQDDLGDSMYFIMEGTARVVHRANGKQLEMAQLAEGDFFGELALVDHGPRSADVEATTDCKLFVINQPIIHTLAVVYPHAAFKLLAAVGRILVKRLRAGNRKYIDSLLPTAQ